MAASEITLSKGSYTVTIYCEEVNDNYNNQIFVIKPAQSTANQSSGSKTAKVVDLLRLNHQIVLRGHITGTATKTAKTIKHELINIWKGAGQDGGVVTLTYDYNGSAFGAVGSTATTTISGYIEKVNFKDVSMDEPTDFQSTPASYPDIAKFEITLTFVEGTII